MCVSSNGFLFVVFRDTQQNTCFFFAVKLASLSRAAETNRCCTCTHPPTPPLSSDVWHTLSKLVVLGVLYAQRKYAL